MKEENWKIVVLIDSCLAHNVGPLHVENINVLFLLANCTSVLQPLNQRIIHAVRVLYRSRLVR
jgi:hypothetical protein